MSRVSLRVATVLMVTGAAGLPVAHADIYTWVDDNGVVNVSNLEPPAGTRVAKVTHEAPQPPTARYDAAREAARQAEVQALAERVRQLENELDAARRPVVVPPPPQVAYAPAPTPMIVPAYTEPPPAPAAPTCDPSWYGCWAWTSGLYPGSVIVLRDAHVRRFDTGHRVTPGHRFHGVAAQWRAPSPGGSRGR